MWVSKKRRIEADLEEDDTFWEHVEMVIKVVEKLLEMMVRCVEMMVLHAMKKQRRRLGVGLELDEINSKAAANVEENKLQMKALKELMRAEKN